MKSLEKLTQPRGTSGLALALWANLLNGQRHITLFLFFFQFGRYYMMSPELLRFELEKSIV